MKYVYASQLRYLELFTAWSWTPEPTLYAHSSAQPMRQLPIVTFAAARFHCTICALSLNYYSPMNMEFWNLDLDYTICVCVVELNAARFPSNRRWCVP